MFKQKPLSNLHKRMRNRKMALNVYTQLLRRMQCHLTVPHLFVEVGLPEVGQWFLFAHSPELPYMFVFLCSVHFLYNFLTNNLFNMDIKDYDLPTKQLDYSSYLELFLQLGYTRYTVISNLKCLHDGNTIFVISLYLVYER